MEIQDTDYKVQYDAETKTVAFFGSLRLSGMEEYAPILDLLDQVAAQDPPSILLNLEKLEFLNSSGINMLSKFVIKLRQKGGIQVVVLGAKTIPWQGKSLKNLQRLMPGLQIDFN